jgi:hypothetical protein
VETENNSVLYHASKPEALRNISYHAVFYYSDKLLDPSLTINLEVHPLSAARGCSWEHGNEPSGSIKDEEFL